MEQHPIVPCHQSITTSSHHHISIIASPFTVTGSIGVVASKPNVSAAASRLGIRAVAITRGRGALLSSPFTPLAGSDLEWMEAHVGESYDRFKAIVAEGRRMSIEAVEEVARGRVWTGPQALERGLVDQVGSLADVIAAARELAALPAHKPHDVVWAAPREGFLRTARWLTRAGGADLIPPELESLLEPLLLARAGCALYYMPPVMQA